MNAIVDYVPSCARTGRHPLKVESHHDGSGRPYEEEVCSECGHYRETIEADAMRVALIVEPRGNTFAAFERGVFCGPVRFGFTHDQAVERFLKLCRERAVIEPEDRT